MPRLSESGSMAKVTGVQIDVIHLPEIKKFITSMQEIAGTTNDPNTAANIHAAIRELMK